MTTEFKGDDEQKLENLANTIYQEGEKKSGLETTGKPQNIMEGTLGLGTSKNILDGVYVVVIDVVVGATAVYKHRRSEIFKQGEISTRD
ncbi:Hypothetical predicted protein [Octopus vulgaris]|uniref:Uncharacterized protein n=1 Tax=Octopus vulgaris TaxID=6645 RepID=A0AA36FK88_OCTVU|nr:Hypothetical predicted protein [Octopus vulgaris]